MAKYLIGYSHHPVTVSYFFARAFRRLGHEIVTIGTPWWGRRHQPKYDNIPDLEVPFGESTYRANWITNLEKVDAVWSFDQGFRIRGRVNDSPTILYGTDPHVIDYRDYSKEYDYFFVAQNMPTGHWIPLGYDPEYHSLTNNITLEERPIDVCFIGMSGPGYERRRAGLFRLKNMGINLFVRQGLFYDDYSRPYNRAKIAYNWSSSFDIPARFFEGMAMGCCMLTNNIPFLDRLGLIDGIDYVSFTDENDLENKTRYLLASGEWQTIALSGAAAVRPHTYDNRVQEMLSVIERGI